ncbi:C-type lectin domain family 2 member D-like [Pelodiscus sinensis]|uniref:C-type lectin domain family 2 member D-like n=1 Tax=Pelodiscus sinensis TaxID=13735 RepID=UPI003F6B4880
MSRDYAPHTFYRIHSFRKYAGLCSVYVLPFITIATLALVVALTVGVFRGLDPPPVGLSCPDGWVGYQRKCYYFSKVEGNWTYSWSNCSALGASLAGINSLQELAFLMHHKGPDIHWIGLRREEEGQPWKWVNGTEFNNLFKVMGGAECAYVDGFAVVSSNCLTMKNWICSKPSLY